MHRLICRAPGKEVCPLSLTPLPPSFGKETVYFKMGGPGGCRRFDPADSRWQRVWLERHIALGLFSFGGVWDDRPSFWWILSSFLEPTSRLQV